MADLSRHLAAALAGCAVLVTSAALAAPPDDARALSLADAVARAVDNDAALRQTRVRSAAAARQVDAVEAQYGPTLDVEGKILLWDDATELTVVEPGALDLSAIPPPFDAALAGLAATVSEPIALRDQLTGQVDVTVVQPLTDLYTVSQGADLARAGQGAAEVRTSLRRRAVVYGVTEAYLNLVAARELVEVAEESVRVIAAHVADAERVAEAGLLSDAEVLAARAELARAQSRRVAGEAKADLLASLLARRVSPDAPERGLAPSHHHVGPVQAPPLTLAEARAHAADNRPELALLDRAIDAERARAKLAAWRRIPQVAAVARYTHNEGVALNPEDSFFVGATLSWRAFDWGKREAEIDAAELAVDALIAKRQAAVDDLRLAAEQRWLALSAARAEADALEASVDAAREGLRAAQAAFAVGESSSTAVLDAELRLDAARASLVRARAQGQITMAALRLALGDPYEPTVSDAELAFTGRPATTAEPTP
ncbi:MAG: hypothetical protein CSA66_00625 [Proteobacteria bacterium]|nr:MAG: hypothetical protein CSA66_00625 [Pseudomonadota bacterium]